MTKLFSLRRFRILALGGAKAQTNDNTDGPYFEENLASYSG
jgi:hypothetical protein